MLAEGYVYIIKCHEYYKIGMTEVDVKGRLSQLQVGNPYKIELIYSIRLPYIKLIEKVTHKEFKDKCIRGEWFKLSGDDLVFIIE